MSSSEDETKGTTPTTSTAATQTTTPISQESRVNILAALKTPLTFFGLVILIVEAIIGGGVAATSGLDRTILIVGMIGLAFFLVALVGAITYLKPESLIVDKIIEKKLPKVADSSLDAEDYKIMCGAYAETKNGIKLQKCAEAALAKDGKDPNALFYEGRAWIILGDNNKAIDSFKKSLDFGPPAIPVDAWYWLAWAYNQKADFRKAEVAAKKAVELDENFGGAWRELAFAYSKLHKMQEFQEADAKAKALGA